MTRRAISCTVEDENGDLWRRAISGIMEAEDDFWMRMT
jgi:hypothetical protein